MFAGNREVIGTAGYDSHSGFESRGWGLFKANRMLESEQDIQVLQVIERQHLSRTEINEDFNE